MFFEHRISVLKWFVKDHVALKTEIIDVLSHENITLIIINIYNIAVWMQILQVQH